MLMPHGFTQAFRSLRRERTSSLLGLVCLSVAIGTNTTVFSVVNGLVVRELPLGSPERLVLLQEYRDRDPSSAGPVSHAVFEELAWDVPSPNTTIGRARRRW